MERKKRRLGLYVHIPFCKSKCSYCDFYSLPHRETDMGAYVQALTRQLADTAPQAAAYTVDSVYFGGGTPSYLGQARLCGLLQQIQSRYRLAPDAEITLEANPDSALDVRALACLRQSGFNRLSLGVQSADDQLLRAIGRIHSYAQVRQAVEAARAAAFANLSLDLIYGLPGQSLGQWQQTLQTVLQLQPEHLSCYGLKVEDGTPLAGQKDVLQLPDDELQADMYLYAVQFLQQQGFEQYEISNFARPGFFSRHNWKYWTLQEYAGFGPGAHSDFGGVRYACVRDLQAYMDGIREGRTVFSEYQPLPDAKRDTEYLMLQLRTARGISGRELTQRYGLPFTRLEQELQRCARSGYARQEGGRWRLTPEGFLLSNQIISLLWEALEQEKQQAALSSPDHL